MRRGAQAHTQRSRPRKGRKTSQKEECKKEGGRERFEVCSELVK